jgi:hypothetical protein
MIVAGLSEQSRERVLEFLRDEDYHRHHRQLERSTGRASAEAGTPVAQVPADGSPMVGLNAVDLVRFLKG